MRKILIVAVGAALASASATAKHGQSSSAEPGQLILYEMNGFAGDYYVVDEPRLTMKTDWNIHSIAVHSGDKWQVCAKPRFGEPCLTLTDSVADSSVIGINGQIGSARLIK